MYRSQYQSEAGRPVQAVPSMADLHLLAIVLQQAAARS